LSYGAKGGHGYGNQRHSGHKSGQRRKPINILDYPYSTWAMNKDGDSVYGHAFKSKDKAMTKALALAKKKSNATVMVREFESGKLKSETTISKK
jgi:hypothetical protein